MRLTATAGTSIQNTLKLFLIFGSLISLSDCLPAGETQDLICEVKSLALADSEDQAAAGLPPHKLGKYAIAGHSPCPKALISISSETRDLLLGVAGPNGSVWREISLKKEDGSRWAIGYIDSISLSPDGTTLLVREETGRLAVIREQSAGYLARGFQLRDYRQMDVGIESKNQQDLFRVFEFPGSIRILTNPEQPYIAMHGLEIKSFCWLDENRFLAISYEDGRIIQFDTHTMRVQRTLRPSQWKRSRHTGNLQFYYEDHGKTIPGAEINLAETGESIYLKPVGLFADQYLLYQEHSQANHLLDLKTGKEINLTLHKGFAVPVSQNEFAIISQEDQKTSCQWIDVREFFSSKVFNVDALSKQKQIVGNLRLNDGHLNQTGSIQLLVSEYIGSDFQYLSTVIQHENQQTGPEMLITLTDQSRLAEKNVKAAVFGPGGQSIRFCSFPQIIELQLIWK